MKYTDVIKPENLTMEFIWETFAKEVYSHVPRDSVQWKEMKTCFMAGVLETFTMMESISNELSEDEAFKVLNRLKEESFDFFKSMVARLKKEGKLPHA